MPKKRSAHSGRGDRTPTEGTAYRSAKSTITPKLLTRNKIDAKRCAGFFDLPREVRDVIYQYLVLSVRQKHRSISCYCDGYQVYITSPRPPHFLRNSLHCDAIDRWLYSVSLLSKQFSTEIRATFLRSTFFRLHYKIDWTPLGRPVISREKDFIYTLGPEAKELRRLDLEVWINVRDENGTVRAQTQEAFEAEDAEYELESYRDVLNPNINIFLELSNYNHGGTDIKSAKSYFHCTSVKDKERAFGARKLDLDYGHWTFYKQMFFKTPEAKRDTMSRSFLHGTHGNPDECDWNAWYG